MADPTAELAAAWQHFNAGRFDDAAAGAQRSIEQAPLASAWRLLGVVRIQQRRFDDAVEALQRARELSPTDAPTWANLADVYRIQQRHSEAIAAYDEALKLAPSLTAIHRQLGSELVVTRLDDRGIVHLRKYLEIDPNHAESYRALGIALQRTSRWAEALDAYRRLVKLAPNEASAWIHLGVVLSTIGQFDEATEVYERAQQIDPRSKDAFYNRAAVWLRLGQLDRAEADFRRVLELDPTCSDAEAGILSCAQYRYGATITGLTNLYGQWYRNHLARYEVNDRVFVNSHDPLRPLRVGFVSGDFAEHPVGSMLIRMIEALDHQQVQPILYSNRAQHDTLSQRFKRAAVIWREVLSLDDEALTAQILDDRIDILIDLSGHTGGKRLAVFTRRPAPLQASWMGFAGPTGVKAIEYVVADHWLAPNEHVEKYRERVIRLDGYSFCFEPLTSIPKTIPTPALRTGHVTFGSFNNVAKLNFEVLATWAEILRRAANSRLVFQFFGSDGASTQARFRQPFVQAGVDPLRIEFFPGSSLTEMTRILNEQIDLGLDPFPFGGGVTSLILLSLGVPIVTWPQEIMAGRQTYAALATLGITDSVTNSREEYIEKAVMLAHSPARVQQLRSTLREVFPTSEIVNGKRLAQTFERAVRELWQQYLARSGSPGT